MSVFDLDLAAVACRDIFGDAVTYLPSGGVLVEGLTATFTPELQERGGDLAAFAHAEPSLDFVATDLVAAGIAPSRGGLDVVMVEWCGVTRTYRVVDVIDGDAGVVTCLLGNRT